MYQRVHVPKDSEEIRYDLTLKTCIFTVKNCVCFQNYFLKYRLIAGVIQQSTCFVLFNVKEEKSVYNRRSFLLIKPISKINNVG